MGRTLKRWLGGPLKPIAGPHRILNRVRNDLLSAGEKIQIIGLGDDGLEGLSQSARQCYDAAEVVLVAEPRLAGCLPDDPRVRLSQGLESTLREVERLGDRRIVFLATGDPLFFGMTRYLCDRLGKDRFEVIPHVSTMQLAFARVKESWDDAYLCNLATQGMDRVVERIRTAEKVGLFTTDDTPPSAIARTLLDRRIDYFSAYVCENLGAPNERVTSAELSEVARQSFDSLNVMILVRQPEAPDRPAAMTGKRIFGNPDELFLQSQPKRGLLTPAEVRCLAIAELDVGPSSTIWDVGAGSGSVSIECAQIAHQGHAFAIEMDPDDHDLIRQNAERFGVQNLTAVLGTAPEAWQGLPAPDAIFVGGTGRQVNRIVEQAFKCLKPGGRIVANVISLENVTSVRATLQGQGADPNVWMVNLARGTQQLESLRFEAVNPSFLISAIRG